MPNHQREIAGIFCGSGGLLALYLGQTVLATALLMGMLGFFIGEKNGERKASKT